MELLESAMAFAVVMIIFSTIVTGIVELILRLLGTREENLKSTMESLFDTIIWPRMKQRLTNSESEAVAKRQNRTAFVDHMTCNPAAPSDGTQDQAGGAKLPALTLHKSRIDALSIMAFAERLGRTDVGKAILAEGEAQLDILLKDFVRSFERFGRAASEIFRKKAKQTAMVVGVLLALTANIDAGRLFTTLVNDPDLRGDLIAQAEQANAANEEAVKNLQALAKSVEEGTLEGDQAEAIKAQADRIAADIEAVEAKGLPIGHAFYPYCRDGEAGDPNCAQAADKGAAVVKWLRWLLLTVVAGILIGLGGPFWFRVFSSLSQVFQVLRALGVGSKQQASKPEAVAAKPEAEDSAKPESVLDAFMVAAEVHAVATAAKRPSASGPESENS